MKIILLILLLNLLLYADIGKILMIRGKAHITRNTIKIPVTAGIKIEEGDTIDVAKRSRVQIMLNDETILTLGSRTHYSFDIYNDAKKPRVQMSIKRGFMRAITGKIGKIAPERFKVKTASATIGIRGTGWEAFIAPNNENFLCFKGEITITTPNNIFDLPAGNMLLLSNNQAKISKANIKIFHKKIKKAEKQSHSKPNKIENQTATNISSQDPVPETVQTVEFITPTTNIENTVATLNENIINEANENQDIKEEPLPNTTYLQQISIEEDIKEVQTVTPNLFNGP